MGLKEGTLESLIESGVDAPTVADFVFPQILQALDCIAWKGIVLRDVKPENILYVSQLGGQYQFQLGDLDSVTVLLMPLRLPVVYFICSLRCFGEGIRHKK